MKIETLFKDSQRQVDEGCKALAHKIENCGAVKRTAKFDAAEQSEMDVMINGLVKQQIRNREGIGKLHDSVQALLRSQGALRQQNTFNNERKAKLEAGLCALDRRNAEAF